MFKEANNGRGIRFISRHELHSSGCKSLSRATRSLRTASSRRDTSSHHRQTSYCLGHTICKQEWATVPICHEGCAKSFFNQKQTQEDGHNSSHLEHPVCVLVVFFLVIFSSLCFMVTRSSQPNHCSSLSSLRFWMELRMRRRYHRRVIVLEA